MTTATLPRTQVPTGVWAIDPADSEVRFTVRHLAVVPVHGEFRQFEGVIEIGPELGSSRTYGTVRAASVDTGNAKRDRHLRSADFFDVVNHPELRFESTRIGPIDGRTVRIVGELAMRGVTRELELEAELGGDGEERRSLTATATLSRSDFAIRPSAAVNAVIADRVELELDLAIVKRD